MSSEQRPSLSGLNVSRIVILIGLVLAACMAWYFLKDSLSLTRLAEQETELRSLQSQYPLLVLAVAFVIYVTVTGLSLPGAAVLSLAYAWYFGFTQALVLISFASSIGATVAFLSSRYIFRDAFIARFGKHLAGFNQALEREGPFYLFSLRLIPAVPFFVINVVMGLTPVRTRTFYIVSQVGMLPGTAAYVYAGSSVPSLQNLAESNGSGIITPRLIAAFVLLAVFPFVVRRLVRFFRPTTQEDNT